MTDAISRRRTWWRLGATARPWLHALVAAAVGAGAAHFSQLAAVASFFVGPAALLGVLVVTGLTGVALGVVAAIGTGSRPAGWIGLTALVLVPAVIGSRFARGFVSAATGGSGEVDLSPSVVPYLVGVAIAAVPALLMHAGPARALGVAVSVAGFVVLLAVAGFHSFRATDAAAQRDREAIARAQVAIGADFRPVTISPSGYGSIFEANIEKRLPGFLQVFSSPASKGHAPGGATGSDLTVVTLASDAPACGRPLEGVAPGGDSEPETSCATRGGFTYRLSTHGQEVAAVAGDTLVAVSSVDGVAVSVLEDAVHSARPIDDQAYRHVLLGDGNEYTDELDGNRCPIVDAVCG